MYPPPPHLLSFLPYTYILTTEESLLTCSFNLGDTPSPDSNEGSLVKYTVKNDYKGVLSHFLDPVSFFITI